MASKLESTMKNMVLSLGIISLVAGTALAGTYLATTPAIEAGRLAKKVAALKSVLPAFDNNPLDQPREAGKATIYTATQGSQVVGYAVQSVSSKGFSGDVVFMTGFKPDGTIFKANVLSQKETPGLGTKMADPGFLNQLEGASPLGVPLKVKKDGGTVDALTAATISSRAALDAVNIAAQALAPTLSQGVAP